MPELNSNKRGFLNFGILTIVAVYILILIGGIVRSTGSGMGCPDWPKCFGNYVPPTDITQLPENYKEVYASGRLKKNKRLASLLNQLGFHELAHRIVNDPSMYIEAEFNPVKTWIEYLNRLAGVTVGLLIIGVVYYSRSFLKSDKIIFWLSLVSLLLVIFEGWLGSIVVSTNLLPGTVSLHMALALLLVILLTYVIVRSQRDVIAGTVGVYRKPVSLILVITLVLTFVQVLIGTQIREFVDEIAIRFPDERSRWIGELNSFFPVHRILSVVLLMVHLYFFYLVLENGKRSGLVFNLSITLIVILGLEIFAGLGLNYADFPAFIQPVHLLLANLLIGIQFLIYILIRYSSKNKVQIA
jgi:cytochrome c oxidase assembly protein subunit 15